jgi:hypothetical protein
MNEGELEKRLAEYRALLTPKQLALLDYLHSGEIVLSWPCLRCGKDAKISEHYAFERDTIAFYCTDCGYYERKLTDI